MDVVNEIERKQRAEARQIREDAEVFGELMKHRGWPRLMSLVETVAQNYHVTVMAPMANIMEATKPEYAKGVLAGLTLAVQLPAMKIKEAHELRRSSGNDDDDE